MAKTAAIIVVGILTLGLSFLFLGKKGFLSREKQGPIGRLTQWPSVKNLLEKVPTNPSGKSNTEELEEAKEERKEKREKKRDRKVRKPSKADPAPDDRQVVMNRIEQARESLDIPVPNPEVMIEPPAGSKTVKERDPVTEVYEEIKKQQILQTEDRRFPNVEI